MNYEDSNPTAPTVQAPNQDAPLLSIPVDRIATYLRGEIFYSLRLLDEVVPDDDQASARALDYATLRLQKAISVIEVVFNIDSLPLLAPSESQEG
jgi:hypothetical protein